MRPDSRSVEIPLPSLCDEAVVEIHDFLNEFLLRFESHYFAQIHRFYGEQFDNNHVQPNQTVQPPDEDPPF